MLRRSLRGCCFFLLTILHSFIAPHATTHDESIFQHKSCEREEPKKIRRIERNKNVLWRESNFYTLQMVGSALFKIHFGFIIILYMLSDTNSERDTFPFSCTFSIISRKRAINREKQLQE